VAFVLVRIDDRLIHGQVTVAWGTWLEPDRIILANDEVAGTPWKRELYSETDTLGAAITVVSVQGFAEGVADGRWDAERVFVIVESPGDLLALIRGGLVVPVANVGGMHASRGKREVLPFVHVDDADVAAMREIVAAGTRLEARDVPQGDSRDLGSLLHLLPDTPGASTGSPST